MAGLVSLRHHCELRRNCGAARSTRARATWRQHAISLRAALEQDGWDGNSYRRGYFDDGTPFRSASNNECRIDSIAQSWGVISGAADSARAARAMAAVDENLIKRETDWRCCSRRRSIKPRWSPAISRAIRRDPRERRPIYACRTLVGASFRQTRRWRQGRRADGDAQSDQPRSHFGRRSALQSKPYVVCADVYSVSPHVGRSGWTWYTGSAGWMYRAGLESILEFGVEGNTLRLILACPKRGGILKLRFGTTKLNTRFQWKIMPAFVAALPAWNLTSRCSLAVRRTSRW